MASSAYGNDREYCVGRNDRPGLLKQPPFVSRLGKDGYVLGSIHGGLILDVRLWR